MNFPQDHPLYAGGDPTPHLDDADLDRGRRDRRAVVPGLQAPRPDATIIQIGHDPLYSRYPIRGFPVDVGLAGTPRLTLAALAEAVERAALDAAAVERGARGWEAEHAARREAARPGAPPEAGGRAHRHGVGVALHRRRVDDDTIVVNEYDLDPTQTRLRMPGSYFGRLRPRGSAGGWARRSAPSWPRPTRPSSAASATAPTSSARPTGGALGSRAPTPARALRHLQQPRVERREALGDVARAAGLGRAAPARWR